MLNFYTGQRAPLRRVGPGPGAVPQAGVVKFYLEGWVVRIYTLAVALLAQGFVVLVRGVFTVEAIGLAFINGVLVAAICMGG